MEENQNKYIAVAYKLYSNTDGKTELVEIASAEKPFQFISGFGVTLPDFEKNIAGLEKGAEFDFILSKDQAYGDYVDERVIDLDRSIFTINGHFDHENIREGGYVELQNADGNHFMALVVEIGDEKVKMDLNHPLAGKELNFKGQVIESRKATKEEIEGMLNRLSGECDCESCQSGCGEKHDHRHEGGCGCGHCH